MEKGYAIFDTVTQGFMEFLSKGFIKREDGSAYAREGSSFVYIAPTEDFEEFAAATLAELNEPVPGRFVLLTVTPA